MGKTAKRMMYINGRFLLKDCTGINRFAYEMCKALVELSVDFMVICPKQNICKSYDVSSFRMVYWGKGNSHFWEQFVLPLYFIGKGRKMILVNFSGVGPVVMRNKIITIHDLAFMANPAWYSMGYRMLYRLLTPLSAIGAKKILTVSRFSQQEIVRLLPVKKEKVEVIYNAVASVFRKEEPEWNKPAVNEKYILAVSSIDPRKNFERLIKAFRLLEQKDIWLYIVGGMDAIYQSVSILSELKDVTGLNILWLGRISDEELVNYYKHAVCFVYPSLYEGFGIPPLEAMAVKCPVIVSDIPVLHEVCGEAALYADPYDEKDIALKIENLCSNPLLREQLRTYGTKQFSAYSWQSSATKLVSIMNNLKN